MFLNTKVWQQVVAAALAAVGNNLAWKRAVERGAREIERSRYWRFADGVLRIQSTSSKKFYDVDANHTCEATRNGHRACKHRAAHRLMMRYVEALAALDAPTPTPAQPTRAQREAERNNAVLVKPQPSGLRYNGVDI
jgi:hypothetical protein